MKKARYVLFVAVMALTWVNPLVAAKIQFKFDAWAGPVIRVFVTRPVGIAPDRPVVFVMHGVNRNADDYRDQWHALAIEHDFLLVVPEFSQRSFPDPENIISATFSMPMARQWRRRTGHIPPSNQFSTKSAGVFQSSPGSIRFTGTRRARNLYTASFFMCRMRVFRGLCPPMPAGI